MSAFDTQVSGDHYKKLAIQPMQYSMANKLDPCQHTVIKYVTRFRDKDGVADLEKAKHIIDMMIELEQRERDPVKPDPESHKTAPRRDLLQEALIAELKARFGNNIEIEFLDEDSGLTD